MLSEFTSYINSGVPFSFIKFGDGEMMGLRATSGHNCDGAYYSQQMSEMLLQSLIKLSAMPRVYIADWFGTRPPQSASGVELRDFFTSVLDKHNIKPLWVKPFTMLLSGWGNFRNRRLYDFFETVRKSYRHKIYVGPQILANVTILLQTDVYLPVSKRNAFQDIPRLMGQINDVACHDSIYLISSGPSSPVLAASILDKYPASTVIDLGSAFDPLFIGQTRLGGQATPEETAEYYAGLDKVPTIRSPMIANVIDEVHKTIPQLPEWVIRKLSRVLTRQIIGTDS